MPREKIFHFKQFSVVNDKTAMKVGTDGVLLGAWCNVLNAHHVLDVGTGCGVVALMIAQRMPTAVIKGIDIDNDAIDEARHNFACCPWGERLTASVADFTEYNDANLYDLIVSNPPFFTNGVIAPNQQRAMARHATSLSLEQLVAGANRQLTENGVLAIITPADAELDVKRVVVENGMWIGRITRVVPVDGAAPKRFLWEISKTEVGMVSDTLVIETSHHEYTQQYIALTRDYYLNM